MSDAGKKLIAEIRKVVSDNPEFIYDNGDHACVYVHDGQPSCLVGHALWNLGYIDSSAESCSVNSESVGEVLTQLGLEIDKTESYWLGRVQLTQDLKHPWKFAVDIADRVYPQPS